MPKESVTIPNEGHTLACMLRVPLFNNGAEFASCTVPHPQATDLVVTVHHGTSCRECLVDSLHDVRNTLESYKKTVLAVRVHHELDK